MRLSYLLFGAMAAVTALAQTAPSRRPMSFDDMMAMKRLGETAVSHDGKWLAYSVGTVHLDQNKSSHQWFLQPVAGGESKAITALEGGDGGLQFSADGRSLLFLSGRDGATQIWTADFDAATGAISGLKQRTRLTIEPDGAILSPDGHSVAFIAPVYPDCPAIAPGDGGAGERCNAERDKAASESKVKAQIFTHLLYKHWDHFTGPKRTHLFLLDLATGGVRDLTPNDAHDLPPFEIGGGSCGCAFSPDSKELAFTENLDTEPATSISASIFTLDLSDPTAKAKKISSAKGGNFNPAYSPDGKYIAWRAEDRPGYESDLFHLALYDRAVKTEREVLMVDADKHGAAPKRLDRWIDEFIWDEGSKQIYFVSGDHGEAPIYSVVLDSGELHRYGKIRGEWSNIHGVWVNDRFRFLGNLMRVNMPVEVVTGDPLEMDDTSQTAFVTFGASPSVQNTTQETYEPRVLTHLNDALLAQLDLPKMQDFWFTAKDGTRLQGFMIPPPGFDAQKKYPVKFLIHGGPQGAWGDAWSYRWNAELFAANGYVVVMVNPRGSTGYGQKVVDGVNGDWGGKPFTDLMQGLDEAEKKFPFIDSKRECALGASYGGFMANWVLGHTDRFRCIVSHDGMFNPESAFGSTEELWFNTWEFKGHPWDYYGKPESENPFRKWSPMMSAKNFKTPTLVIHGQRDYRLDVSEGYQFFTTLQLLGVPSKMLYFPDEGHWVLKPQNSQLWYKTVNDWVDQWSK